MVPEERCLKKNTALGVIFFFRTPLYLFVYLLVGRQPAGAPLSINISIVNDSFVRYPDLNQSTLGPFLLDGFAEVTSTFLRGRLDVCTVYSSYCRTT